MEKKKTHSAKVMDYIHKFDKQNYKRFTLRIRKDDKIVNDKLDSVKSKNDYIINLIRSDSMK